VQYDPPDEPKVSNSSIQVFYIYTRLCVDTNNINFFLTFRNIFTGLAELLVVKVQKGMPFCFSCQRR
jgi:hypothetical protein